MGRVGGRCGIPAVTHHSPAGSCPWASGHPPKPPILEGQEDPWGQGTPHPAGVQPPKSSQSRALGTTSPPSDCPPGTCSPARAHVRSVGSHIPQTSHPSERGWIDGGSLAVLGTVQTPVSPQCPPPPRAPAKPSKGTALRWRLLGELQPRACWGSRMLWDGFSLTQNHSLGFFPAVLPPSLSSPFTPMPPTPLLRLLKSWLLSGQIFAGCSSCSRLPCCTDFPVFLRICDSSSSRGIARPPSLWGGGCSAPLLPEQHEAEKSKGVETPPGFPPALVTCHAFGSSAAILESESSEEEDEEEEAAMVQVLLIGSFSVLFLPPAHVRLRW